MVRVCPEELRSNRYSHVVKSLDLQMICLLGGSVPLFDLLENSLLSLVITPASIDGSLGDTFPLEEGQIESLLNSTVVVENVTTEVSWVVRVDAELDTSIEELSNWQLGNLGHTSQADIGQWTHSDESLLASNTLEELFILDQTDSMVDSLSLADIQGSGDVGGVALLTGMGRSMDAFAVRGLEDLSEDLWWEANFTAVQSNSSNGAVGEVTKGISFGKSGIGLASWEVTKEAENKLAGEPEIGLSSLLGFGEALNDGGICNTTGGVCLRVEEDLGVDNAI
jgi:hypothetical protein